MIGSIMRRPLFRYAVPLLFLMTASAAPAQIIVPLWDGPAPQSHGTTPNDIPTLTVFLPKNAGKPTSAIVICPGGGYGMLAFEHEGTNEGAWFQKKGVAAFVLKYRLPVNGYRHPVPLMDAQRALRLVRSHAVLVYAVISMQDGVTHQGSKLNLLGPNPDPALVKNLSNETQVTTQTPPTVLVHAEDDGAVPIENSRLMFAALQKAGVPSVLQEYPHGGHGFGFGNKPDNSPPGWLDKAYDWLKDHGCV
jgi:acetyl esterase/lipase